MQTKICLNVYWHCHKNFLRHFIWSYEDAKMIKLFVWDTLKNVAEPRNSHILVKSKIMWTSNVHLFYSNYKIFKFAIVYFNSNFINYDVSPEHYFFHVANRIN